MNYVIAGYVVAMATLFIYALTLVWRRRRWARTYERVLDGETMKRTEAPGTTTPSVSGGRP